MRGEEVKAYAAFVIDSLSCGLNKVVNHLYQYCRVLPEIREIEITWDENETKKEE